MYIILPVLALSLLVAGTSYAATKTADYNPFSKIASAIAEKFNLNSSDVQAVIDETVAADRAEMGKNRPERVDPLVQAVKNGKLTQAQADLITAKREEIKTSMESQKDTLKNMTQVEREAARKTQMDSLKQWATDNGIPEQYVLGFGGMGDGHGGPFGRGFHQSEAPDSDAQTPAN